MTTVSSAQTIALAGLLNGQGLTTSQTMLNTFNTFNSQTFVTLINNIYAGEANTAANVAGLTSNIALLPKWVTGRDSNISIPSTVTTRANLILINSVSGYKNFASFMSKAAGFCSSVLPWYASLNKYQGQSFSNIGLGSKSYTDLTSGGATRYLAVLKNNPEGFNQSIKDLATAVSLFGTAFDFSTISLTFTPLNFLANLRKQGLGSMLAPYLRTVYSETTPRNDNQLIEMFREVTDYDLTKIITVLDIRTRPGVKITSLADFFDSKIMLPNNLQSLTPSGSMTDLVNNIGLLGGTYTSAAEFATYLNSLVTTDNLTQLESQTQPLPADVVSTINPSIGQGYGTGPLGNPRLVDLIGTVAGANVTVNFQTINNAQAYIGQSGLINSVYSSLLTIYNNDKSGSPVGSLSGLTSAITAFNNNQNASPILGEANTAITNTLTQLTRETALSTIAGIDITSPSTISSSIPLMSLARSLPQYGVDSSGIGYEEIFTAIADQNSKYGDAVRASLQEGKNQTAQKNVNIPDNMSADYTKILRDNS